MDGETFVSGALHYRATSREVVVAQIEKSCL